jgi:DivIVA domain-containing protein
VPAHRVQGAGEHHRRRPAVAGGVEHRDGRVGVRAAQAGPPVLRVGVGGQVHDGLRTGGHGLDEGRIPQVTRHDAGAGPQVGQPQIEPVPQTGDHHPADQAGRAGDQHRARNLGHDADDSMSRYVFTGSDAGAGEVARMERLRPVDIRNIAFGKPPIGRRGYDESEVDAFLDHVEQTLSQLYHEIALLRGEPTAPGGVGGQQLALPSGHAGANVGEQAILAELDQIKLRLARIESAVTATARPARNPTFGNF